MVQRVMVMRVAHHHDQHHVFSGESFSLERQKVHGSEQLPGPCSLSGCLRPGGTDVTLYNLIFLAFLFKLWSSGKSSMRGKMVSPTGTVWAAC